MANRYYAKVVKYLPLSYLTALALVLFLFLLIANQILEEDEKLEIGLQLFNPCSVSLSRKSLIWSVPSTTDYKGKIYSDTTFSYQNPKTYSGPVIQGWEPEKDRNLTRYVRPLENTALLDPLNCEFLKGAKREKLDMIIVQRSSPKNFGRRLENRATWMTFAKKMPEFKIIFLVGVPSVTTNGINYIDINLQNQLEEEFGLFGDILQVDCVDSYSNETLKSILSLKYLLGINWKKMNQESSPPRFVMHSDDDIYINLPLIRRIIVENKKWNSLSENTHWPPLMGVLMDRSPIIHIAKEAMIKKFVSEMNHTVPLYFYDGEGYYPPYMHGAGYFIPWWSIPCLYQQSFQLPYFFIEPIFLGGWVADRCSVPKHHLEGIKIDQPKQPIRLLDPSSEILIHGIDKNQKVRVHRKFSSAFQNEED